MMNKIGCNKNVIMEVSFVVPLKDLLLGNFDLKTTVTKQMENDKYWIYIKKELQKFDFTEKFLNFIKDNLHKYFSCDVDLAYREYDTNDLLDADVIEITVPVEIDINELNNQFLLRYGYLCVGE